MKKTKDYNEEIFIDQMAKIIISFVEGEEFIILSEILNDDLEMS